MASNLKREQLIERVNQVIYLVENGDPEGRMGELLMEVKENLPHPTVSDLIFLSDPPKSAEEVVDEALAYKPIQR